MTNDPDGDQEPKKKIPGLPPEEAATLKQANVDGDTGQQEAKILTRDFTKAQIEKEAATREHQRSEWFKDHFERLAIISLYAVFLIFLTVGGIWFWHLLTPWPFLTPEQVKAIQNIATGGIIASIATGHAKKRLG